MHYILYTHEKSRKKHTVHKNLNFNYRASQSSSGFKKKKKKSEWEGRFSAARHKREVSE